MTDRGARELGKALRKNRTLKELLLLGRGINDKGASAIAQDCKSNVSLESMIIIGKDIQRDTLKKLETYSVRNKKATRELSIFINTLTSLLPKEKRTPPDLLKRDSIHNALDSSLDVSFASHLDYCLIKACSIALSLEDIEKKNLLLNFIKHYQFHYQLETWPQKKFFTQTGLEEFRTEYKQDQSLQKDLENLKGCISHLTKTNFIENQPGLIQFFSLASPERGSRSRSTKKF